MLQLYAPDASRQFKKVHSDFDPNKRVAVNSQNAKTSLGLPPSESRKGGTEQCRALHTADCSRIKHNKRNVSVYVASFSALCVKVVTCKGETRWLQIGLLGQEMASLYSSRSCLNRDSRSSNSGTGASVAGGSVDPCPGAVGKPDGVNASGLVPSLGGIGKGSMYAGSSE
eukprot:m.431234 g.431234  ORF g.431234 m.431234 type:complete len:170 (+) comp17274_c0_seq1:3962-4471(+)